MNKKLFGVRLGAIFSLILCFIASFLIWLYVGVISDYNESAGEQTDDTAETVSCVQKADEVL